jgi:hypothetical protein
MQKTGPTHDTPFNSVNVRGFVAGIDATRQVLGTTSAGPGVAEEAAPATTAGVAIVANEIRAAHATVIRNDEQCFIKCSLLPLNSHLNSHLFQTIAGPRGPHNRPMSVTRDALTASMVHWQNRDQIFAVAS